MSQLRVVMRPHRMLVDLTKKAKEKSYSCERSAHRKWDLGLGAWLRDSLWERPLTADQTRPQMRGEHHTRVMRLFIVTQQNPFVRLCVYMFYWNEEWWKILLDLRGIRNRFVRPLIWMNYHSVPYKVNHTK